MSVIWNPISGKFDFYRTPDSVTWGSSVSGTTADGLTLTLNANSDASASALRLAANNTQANTITLGTFTIGTSGKVQGLDIFGTGSNTTGKQHLRLWGNTDGNANTVLSVGNGAAFAETFSIGADGKVAIGTTRDTPYLLVSSPATTYTNNSGSIKFTRTGNLTGLAGETFNNVLIQPAFQLTDPDSGAFTFNGLNINMGSMTAVTAPGGVQVVTGLSITNAYVANVTNYGVNISAAFNLLSSSYAGGYTQIKNDGMTSGYSAFVSSTSTGASSGIVLYVSKTGTGGSTSFTGDVANITWTQNHTAAATVNHSANGLDLSRAITSNHASAAITVSGALLNVNSTNVQTLGTMTDSGIVALFTQGYTSASGTVVSISNLGTGNDIAGACWSFNNLGKLTIAPTAKATPTMNYLLITGAADTALTAGTELSDIKFNLGRTVQFATGALTSQRAIYIAAPTYSFVGASTLTNAATLYIDKAPAAGTNATITNAYSIWIDDGASRFDGVMYSYGGLWTNTAPNNAQVVLQANALSYFYLVPAADDGTLFCIAPTDGTANHNIIITSTNNYLKAHGHTSPSTDPTLILHSATDPTVSNNQWGSINHNQTNLQIVTGAEVGTGSVPTTINNGLLVALSTLTAGAAGNFGVSITRTLNDSSTAGGETYDHILGTITETDKTGWPTVNLINLKVATASKFSVDDSGTITRTGRLLGVQGVDVASANDITLGLGNYFDITGTTEVQRILGTGWTAGSFVTLQFDASVTVKHNTAAGSGYYGFLLAGAADFSATANDTLTIVFTGSYWMECARTAI